MKKLFTLLACSAFSLAVFSQGSFQILEPGTSNNVAGTTIDLWGDPSTHFETELNVKNISSSTKTVKMKRVFISGISLAPDSDIVTVCWNVCLQPSWNTTQTAGNVQIASGAMASFSTNGIGFHSSVEPNSQLGTRSIRYVFYDNANNSDSAYVTINYHVTAVGMKENNIAQFSFSNPQPNPANGSTTIKYDFPHAAKAKIKIYNAVGTVVKEVKVEDANGKITISTEELSNGIYFYSLIVGDKIVGTKKLIVAN